MAALQDIEVWTRATGRAIVEWAAADIPGFTYDKRVPAGWPFMELDQAMYAVAVYAVIVAIGLLRMQPSSPKKEEKPVAQKFRDEPVLYLQSIYNLTQVLLCGWMMYAALQVAWNNSWLPVCNAADYRNAELAPVLWVFYVSKILDFFDTFFIITRGKWEQFIFLHVYHHFSIFLTYWLVTNAAYDGDVYYTIVANSFVHLVMYSYYFATTFNVKLTIGKYVTQLQMVQFITMMAQALVIIFKPCAYPRRITIFYLFYILSLFLLFYKFYMGKHGKGDKKGKTSGKGADKPKTS